MMGIVLVCNGSAVTYDLFFHIFMDRIQHNEKEREVSQNWLMSNTYRQVFIRADIRERGREE